MLVSDGEERIWKWRKLEDCEVLGRKKFGSSGAERIGKQWGGEDWEVVESRGWEVVGRG